MTEKARCTLGKIQSLQSMMGKLTPTCKSIKLSLPYTINKINSKWIQDLNVILQTIKLLEENTGTLAMVFWI